jgi:hypothetical protein
MFQQKDNYSCGPWVIYTAKQRMAGLPIEPVSNEASVALQIREDIVSLLRGALTAGNLVPQPSKRRGGGIEQLESGTSVKKQKLVI